MRLRELIRLHPIPGDEVVLHGGRVSYHVVVGSSGVTVGVTRQSVDWGDRPGLDLPIEAWYDLVNMATTVSRDPIMAIAMGQPAGDTTRETCDCGVCGECCKARGRFVRRSP